MHIFRLQTQTMKSTRFFTLQVIYLPPVYFSLSVFLFSQCLYDSTSLILKRLWTISSKVCPLHQLKHFFLQHLSLNSLIPIIRITSGIMMKPPSGKFPIIKICVLIFIIILYAESFKFLSSGSIFNFKPCPTNSTKPKSSKSSSILCNVVSFGVTIYPLHTKTLV